MRRPGPPAALALLLLAAGVSVGQPSAAAAPSAAAPAVAAAPPATVIAVRGPDDALWVSPADTTVGQWTSLGGRLAAVPAVLRGPFGVFLIGVGTDQQLYVRTYGRGWTPLGPPGTRCLQVAASLDPTSPTGDSALVGCLAPNDRIYVGQIPPGTLSIPRWTAAGAPPGVQRAPLRMLGSALYAIGRPTTFADGGVSTVYRSLYAGYPWTLEIPPFPVNPPANLHCGDPAKVYGDYFGFCRTPDDALYWFHVAYGCATCGGEQISGVAVGRVTGRMDAGPENAERTTAVFGLGTNNQVYRWTVRYTLVDRPAWSGPRRFTGVGVGGVAVG